MVWLIWGLFGTSGELLSYSSSPLTSRTLVTFQNDWHTSSSQTALFYFHSLVTLYKPRLANAVKFRLFKSWLISVLGSKPKGTLYIFKHWGLLQLLSKVFFSRGLGTPFDKVWSESKFSKADWADHKVDCEQSLFCLKIPREKRKEQHKTTWACERVPVPQSHSFTVWIFQQERDCPQSNDKVD